MTSVLGDEDKGQVIDVGTGDPYLTVVIPFYNEEENIEEAVAELLHALDGMQVSSEVILVDDGSKDATGERALRWRARDPRVGVVQFRRNFGQTSAIDAGFREAKGRVIVVMDGDMQNDPADIPKLLEGIANGYDVVSGWRKNRRQAMFIP